MPNNRDMIKAVIGEMTQNQVYDTVEIVFKFTGATSIDEVKQQLDSRFNNNSKVKVNAIPLGDWCKDNNYNRLNVFNTLRDTGYLNEDNSLTDAGFGELHNIDYNDEIAVSDLVLFNTNYLNGRYTVMVNPSSNSYKAFLAILANIKAEYIGSKGFNAKKVCKTMRSLCSKFRIVA